MEKKIEIITKTGRIVRVMPHMLSDMARFEATQQRPTIRNTPKELLDIPKLGEKTIILPKMQSSVPEAQAEPVKEVKTRKAPVRSKAKK